MVFRDVAASAGINAQIRCGGPEKKWIPEANGSGVAWLDYDNDGLMDLLIVNGSSMRDLRLIASGTIPPAQPGSLYLYRNLGGGHFEDVTLKAGLANPYWGTGANAADFDNDGFTDILVTSIGRDLLFHNNGDGTFTDISQKAGLTRKIAWHTGSAFGDYDGDGKLDLYVAGYVSLDALDLSQPAPVCNYRGIAGFCGPRGMKGEPDILYHNNGDGTFTDVTERAHVKDTGLYHGFSVVFDDFNGDGKIDIFVANDSDPNYLYLNRGDGTFKEAGLPSGVAVSADGNTQANMGAAVGDIDNAGHVDLLTTTFSEDYFPLFKQQQPGVFEDVSGSVGFRNATLPWVGWACGFADFDNDGHRELWTANGHVYPNAEKLATSSYNQPIALFSLRRGSFDRPVVVLDAANSHRGGATADFNNDGRMDLVVLPIAGRPVLLENQSGSAGNWCGFRLRGRINNRDGIGAKLWVEACGSKQFESVRSGGSYLSRNDPRIHFGLGKCSAIERVTVEWPGGKRQIVRKPEINRYVDIEEPRQ